MQECVMQEAARVPPVGHVPPLLAYVDACVSIDMAVLFVASCAERGLHFSCQHSELHGIYF